VIAEPSRRRIKALAGDLLDRVIHKQLVLGPFDWADFGKRRPFQRALVPVEQVWKGAAFERAFVTSLGQNVFQQIAVEVAAGPGAVTDSEHDTTGDVWTGQLETVDAILRELRNVRSGRRPNWPAERDAVIRARGSGYKTKHSVHSDIYVKRPDGTVDYYSLKTSLPNLDQTELAKRMMLELTAIDPKFRCWFALPDNPFVTRDAYKHSFPGRIFNMQTDDCVLIGKDFWNHVGGPGAYDELLALLRDVGEGRRSTLEKRYLGI